MEKKIAIACQGGGSQTAFTAGVLKSFFENGLQEKRQVVSLSGTSGGALCAALIWYSMIKATHGDKRPVYGRLMDFWEDNATGNTYENFFNDLMVNQLRLIDGGYLPRWELSPSSPWLKPFSDFLSAASPNSKFYNLKALLESHIDFDEIRNWGSPATPVLLVGAADVLEGTFKKFSSLKGEIQVEALLASASVPEIFPAVAIGSHYYWDGLYSDNPPIDQLLDENFVGPESKADEIWIIQINPMKRGRLPKSAQEIIDRRNEMTGNVSLYQGLEKIRLINRFLAENALHYGDCRKYKPIDVYIIEMSPDLQQKLDLPTKLDRNRTYINTLIADGERRGRDFLEGLGLAPSRGGRSHCQPQKIV